MAARPSGGDFAIDPGYFARLCLDDELFGPDQPLREQEVHARVADLPGTARAESRDIFCRRRSLAQQRFRSRVDRAADLWPPAAAAAQSGVGVFHQMIWRGLGAWGLPKWELLAPQHQRLRREMATLRGIDAPSTAQSRSAQIAAFAETLRELEPVWRLVDAVSDLLNARYPALASLPWGADWILRLAGDRPPGTTYRTARTRPLNVFGGAGIRTVHFQPPDPNLPPVEVDWSDSREETRQRLTAVLERLFYAAFLREDDLPSEPMPDAEALRHDRRFQRWLGRSEAWAGTEAALESALDGSHPRGTRPHTRDPLRRIRRDVAIWAQVEIEGRSAVMVAGDHAERYDDEPTFRASTGGRRSRLPTTAKGVRDAIERAQRLLREPELSRG